ncbi:MAG: hypothetical protein K2O89_07505, partial [Clostridia bacterium]|nr:hypothetical protein [Clostridia bacterium]
MKTSLKQTGKLKLVLFLTLCAVLIGCAVFLCFEIFNQNNVTAESPQQAEQTEISAPDREASSTSTTVLASPYIDGTSMYTSSGVTVSGNTATATYTGSTINFGISGFDRSKMTATSSSANLSVAPLNGGVSLVQATEAGTYTLTIKLNSTVYIFATGSSITYTITISRAALSTTPAFTTTRTSEGVTLSGNTATATYKGSNYLVGVSGYSSSTMTATLTSGSVIVAALNAASVVDVTAAGTHRFTITPSDTNHKFADGSLSKTFTITISKLTVTAPTISSYPSGFTLSSNTVTGTYNGSTNNLFIDGYASNTNQDFITATLSGDVGAWGGSGHRAISPGSNAGTASVTFSLDSNCVWSTGSSSDIVFTIKVNPRNITNASFGTVSNQTYNGSAFTPTPTITDSGLSKTLTNNTDFTYSYSNNTNAGTATVTITGKGNYTGTKSTTFTISARNISNASFGTIAAQTYNYGTAITPTPTITDSGISKTLTNNTDFTFSYSNNINAGSATITITGKGNYTGTKSTTFTINGRNLSGATIGTITNQSYDGTEKKP